MNPDIVWHTQTIILKDAVMRILSTREAEHDNKHKTFSEKLERTIEVLKSIWGSE